MSYYLRFVILMASILTLIYVIAKIRKAQIQLQDSLFWLFLGVVFVIMGLFPQVVYFFTRKMGFQAPVNLIFLVMIFILLIKVFLSSIKISQLENKLDTLVQELAVSENLKNEEDLKKEKQPNLQDETCSVL